MQTFRRILVAAAALGVAGTASAGAPPERGYRFTAPDGLVYNESLSIQVAQDLAALRHYDGLPTALGADAYTSDDGLAFYVLWIHATEPANNLALAVRRTFDRLRQAPVDRTSKVSSAELVSWQEDVADDLALGLLEWRHLSNETVSRVQARMWASADRMLHQVRGECVMRATDVERLRPRCDAALAALVLTDADRADLGTIPSAGTLKLSDAADGGPMLLVVEGGLDAGASTTPSLRPPTQGAVLYERPARTTGKDASSNTFLYLGGAALLIIAIYVFMRRSSDEDETSE